MTNIMYQKMSAMEKEHWWFSTKRKIVFKLLLNHFGVNINSVADFGCGTGVVLHEMQSKFNVKTLHGFDFSSIALDYCRENFGQSFQELDLSNMVSWSSTYDCILLLDILEHIAEDDIAIKNVFNALNCNGLAIITVPAYPFLWSSHDKNCMHKRRYTVKTLRNLISKTELNIKYLSYYNCFLFPFMLASRLFFKYIRIYTQDTVENKLPPNLFNKFLKTIFGFEEYFISRYSKLPFGGSIICIVEKPC